MSWEFWKGSTDVGLEVHETVLLWRSDPEFCQGTGLPPPTIAAKPLSVYYQTMGTMEHPLNGNIHLRVVQHDYSFGPRWGEESACAVLHHDRQSKHDELFYPSSPSYATHPNTHFFRTLVSFTTGLQETNRSRASLQPFCSQIASSTRYGIFNNAVFF